MATEGCLMTRGAIEGHLAVAGIPKEEWGEYLKEVVWFLGMSDGPGAEGIVQAGTKLWPVVSPSSASHPRITVF